MDNLDQTTVPPRAWAAVVAGVMLNLVFGSLYAWSIFIPGLEMEFGIMRADVSIVFSLAIVSFTIGNFVSPHLFGRVPIAVLPLGAAAIGAGGLALASMGGNYLSVIIGYGAMFGFGCGFSYNAALQAAQSALVRRPGLANGIIISAFAFGAVASASVLSDSVEMVGVGRTLWLLAITVVAVGIVATALYMTSGIHLPTMPPAEKSKDGRRILQISWIGFFLGALAGVMAIGHAAPVITHFGGTTEAAVIGVTLLGLGNAIGRLGAGWLCDHISVRSVAGIAHLTGAIGFVVVLANPVAEGAVITMCMAGIAYGMTASVYPTTMSIFGGRAAYGRNFAIILTAWGVAGLVGPWLGGFMFDLTGDYRASLEFACVAAILAVVNAMRLPRTREIKT